MKVQQYKIQKLHIKIFLQNIKNCIVLQVQANVFGKKHLQKICACF
jgi:hypothetical protein